MDTQAVGQFFERVGSLYQTYLPPEYQMPVLPVAAVMLVAGVGLSVFGAKAARSGIVLLWAVIGVLVGAAVAPEVDWPFFAVTALGGVLGAIIGLKLYRLWVGVGMAAFLAVAVFAVYGVTDIVPHFMAYTEQMKTESRVAEAVALATVEPGAELPAADSHTDQPPAPGSEAARADLERIGRDFWAYLHEREADVAWTVQCVAALAAVIGLICGLIAGKLALILSTALLGTVLILGGLTGLAVHFHPQTWQSVGQQPNIIGAAALVLVLAAVVFQFRLNRSRKMPRQPGPPPDSDCR